MSDFLITGYDIFPVVRTETRGDGSEVEYELYHTRAHMLTSDGKAVTTLFGPPTSVEQAHDTLDDISKRRKAGDGVARDLVPSEPRKFRLWGRPSGAPMQGEGIVSGHAVLWLPRERRGNVVLPPQLVPFLTVLVWRDNGFHDYIFVRLHRRLDLPASANLVQQIQEKWDYLRMNWDTGAEVKFHDHNGLWILSGALPKAPSKEPPTQEQLQALQDWANGGA